MRSQSTTKYNLRRHGMIKYPKQLRHYNQIDLLFHEIKNAIQVMAFCSDGEIKNAMWLGVKVKE